MTTHGLGTGIALGLLSLLSAGCGGSEFVSAADPGGSPDASEDSSDAQADTSTPDAAPDTSPDGPDEADAPGDTGLDADAAVDADADADAQADGDAQAPTCTPSCGPNMECVATNQCECLPDWGDCDSQPNTGCEANLQDDATHCGDCATACVNPPSPVCVSSTQLQTWESAGTCNGGSCEYASSTNTCGYGCSNGVCGGCVPNCQNKACGDDGCNGSCGDCSNAPAPSPHCLTSIPEVLVAYPDPAVCEAFACVYHPVEKMCDFGCEGSFCRSACEGECAVGVCGDNGCGTACEECPVGEPLAPEQHEKLSILARWWLPNYGNGDTLTANSKTELPATAGANLRGQLFYVAADLTPGTKPINRFMKPSPGDHMDSNANTETGYTKELTLAYAYSTPVAGTCPIRRGYNAAIDDHRTLACHEDVAGSSYVLDGVQLGWGFDRHEMSCDVPLQASGTQVTIKANLVAGGAISALTWNGKQYVNNYDFGRQIQVRFLQSETSDQDVKSESGDRWGCANTAQPAWAHGAPLVQSSVAGKVLTTKTYPLLWEPAQLGGSEDHPVRWRGTIQKMLELDHGASPNVIKWTTTVDFPGGSNFIDLEMVSAHLVSDFNRYYMFDAFENTTTDKTGSLTIGSCLDGGVDDDMRPVAGAAILATADGNYALGLYRKSLRNGFRLCKATAIGSGGESGPDSPTVAAVHSSAGGIAAGPTSFVVYVLVGSLATVESKARQLYLGGT